MMRARAKFRNRRGATLAVVAVSMIAMLAVMALAIDLGMGYAARNEAQRTADAAALAGASAFLDSATWASTIAPRRAKEYVAANYILSTSVDSATEAAVNVSMLNNRVRVTVWRYRIPTWFARVFGVDSVDVSATAVAEAVDAGAAKCVRPWGIQDLWSEIPNDPAARPAPTDKYDPVNDGDWYQPAVTQPDNSATGYGREATDNGKLITIKSQRPTTGPDSTSLAQPGPGEFMIWPMPEDPTLDNCATNGSTGSPSYIYQNSICSCNKNSVRLGVQVDEDGDTIRWKPGNTVGPTENGLEALVATDPNAAWDESTGSIINSEYPDLSSPRVVKIGLIPPLPPPPGQNWTQANMPPVEFSTFALLFIEGFYISGQGNTKQINIVGRFLYSASGEEGPVKGNLVKYLRLVE